MPIDYIPKPYQKIAINHMIAEDRCALWAGMGTGKTSAALTYVKKLNQQGVDSPTLVLAPVLVAGTTWPQESKKWRHLSDIHVEPVIGTEKQRMLALSRDANIFTINYENLPWLVDLYGKRWPFKTVIADESTRLKSFRLRQGGQRAAALGKVAHDLVDRFVQLTGTPAPNGLIDLWGQIWMLDRGERLGRTFSAFKERYFRPNPSGYGIQPMPHSDAQIHQKLRDICLTIDAKDWFDLDEPIVNNIYVELPEKTRRLYKQMEKEFYYEIEGHGVEASHSAAKSQKLLQLASGAVYVDPLADTDSDPRSKQWKQAHDQKIQALESIITESAGMPVLVAYHFRSDRERLTKAFPKGVALTRQNNIQVQDGWNRGKIPILFVHPASAGHGLNLQDGGNILVYFSHDWNLEYRQQVLERIGPMRQKQAGHDRPVFVYNIIARNTMDEIVIDRTDGKKTIQDALLDAMNKNVLTK